MMASDSTPVRKGRGKGKKPALVCTSIRLSQSTIDFFKWQFKGDAQKKMREVLELHQQNFSSEEGVPNDI
jgi:hypothetical protein